MRKVVGMRWSLFLPNAKLGCVPHFSLRAKHVWGFSLLVNDELFALSSWDLMSRLLRVDFPCFLANSSYCRDPLDIGLSDQLLSPATLRGQLCLLLLCYDRYWFDCNASGLVPGMLTTVAAGGGQEGVGPE